MSKNQCKKATLEDLIAKKIQKEKDKNKTKDIYISSMDKILTFVKPKENVVLDAIDEIGDGKDTRNTISAFKHLMYECCPLLQNQELQKELEILDPYDIVDVLFELGEVMKIGEQLVDLFGLGSIDENIKNS